MPVFMFLTAFANLFGLGGSSLISRCLGSENKQKARHCASFCIWAGIAVAFVYGILIVALRPVLFPILGATEDTREYYSLYVFWTIGVGSVPTVMNAEFAHLIRAEGYSKQAGLGVALGGVLNIVLDPIFIFLFGLEIRGAAIATMLSNLIAMGYFALFLYHIRDNTVITASLKEFSLHEKNSAGGFVRRTFGLSPYHDVNCFKYGAKPHRRRIFQRGNRGNGHCEKDRPHGVRDSAGNDAGHSAAYRIQLFL